MVASFTVCTKEEQHAVIQFLWAEDVRCAETYPSAATVFCRSEAWTERLACSRMTVLEFSAGLGKNLCLITVEEEIPVIWCVRGP